MLPALILLMVIESHITFWVTAELKLPPRMQNKTVMPRRPYQSAFDRKAEIPNGNHWGYLGL